MVERYIAEMFPNFFQDRSNIFNKTNQTLDEWMSYLEMGESEPYHDRWPAVPIVISIVYSIVCALGLIGNVLVLYLMKSRQGWKKSSINVFVTCLAATDFQFVLTMPFWAVDTALDFSWPFGKVMCKIVTSVTVMNMYASVFFLTAMSIARYWSVASALKPRRQPFGCSAKWMSVLIWLSSLLATIPSAMFSTTSRVTNVELCLVRFPNEQRSQFWMGLYHIQKVLVGFLIPLGVITVCYLLLLRYVTNKNIVSSSSTKRRSKVTKSVTIVVLSFFLCWLPNQTVTLWGVLVKFNALHFSSAYYTTQAYVFPVTVCLAHTNSCLNPILYCLMRREFRKALRNLFWKVTSPTITTMRPFTATTKPERDDQRHSMIPLNPVLPEILYYPPGVVIYNSRCDILPASSAEQRY